MPPLRAGAAVLATALLALTTGTLVFGLAAPASAHDEPPAAPEFTSPYDTRTGGSRLATTDDSTPLMAGVAEPGATIKVVVSSSDSGGSNYCSAAVTASGTWNCVGGALAPGRYNVSATATNSRGDCSRDGGPRFDLEIVAPAPPPPPPPPPVVTPLTAPVVAPPAARPVQRAAPAAAPVAIVWELHLADVGGLNLDDRELTLGDKVVLWGSGLPPGSAVSAELHSDPIALGSSVVADTGEFRLLVTVPDTLPAGPHQFVVTVMPADGSPSTSVRGSVFRARPAITPRSHAIAQSTEDVAATTPTELDTTGTSLVDPTIFGNSLVPANELVIDRESLLIAGSLSALFLLLVALPVELLEGAVRENYGRAFAWLDPIRRRVKAVVGWFHRRFPNPWTSSLLLVAIGAVILGFADPQFGFTGKSVRLVIALAISLAVLNIAISAVVLAFGHRRFGVRNAFAPMPAALIVVALSVILSRLTGIPTAFLFGLVVSIVWTHRQTIRQSGALALLLMTLTIAVGVGSFLIYSALHASHDEGFWHELGIEVFAGLSLESLATLLIALLPLKILDGRRIFVWSRVAWVAVYLVALISFVLVVTPVAHEHGLLESPPWGWVVAFASFAAIAVIVWALFRAFPGREEEEEEEEAEDSEAATPSNRESEAELPSPPPR